MKKWMIGAMALACGWTAQANAAYNVTFRQVAGNVVATGLGSLNITGLSAVGDFSDDMGFIAPGRNIALIGGANETIYNSTLSYSGVLGTGGGLEFATSGTGGLVGVLGGTNQFAVPVGYVSGTTITNTSVFAGQTFASLGLNLGTVIVGFNSGVNADRITFQIGDPAAAVPEAASWAMMILGMGAIGFMMRRRRGSAGRVSYAI